MTARLFGSRPCELTLADLVDAIIAAPASGGVRLLVTMNLDHVVQLRRNQAFRAAYARAWAVTVDGSPVFTYARLRGVAPPERVTGADLLVELARRLPTHRRPFFVVSSPRTGERLTERLVSRGFPRDGLAHASPAFGFEADAAASAALVAAIRAHGTTDLVFGLGAPKSEVWIDTHRAALGDLYAYGFGAGLDFLAGVAARAPMTMRRAGLEWAWRLARNPVRLWRRYLVDSWAAAPAIAQDLAGRAPHGGARLED